jgi:lipopolysaccharide export LptBFGC system permease protein LptF
MAYLNGLKAADDWLSDGAYSPVVGLWWVHGIFIGLALVLLLLRFRIHHRRPGAAH